MPPVAKLEKSSEKPEPELEACELEVLVELVTINSPAIIMITPTMMIGLFQSANLWFSPSISVKTWRGLVIMAPNRFMLIDNFLEFPFFNLVGEGMSGFTMLSINVKFSMRVSVANQYFNLLYYILQFVYI